ncbi:DUF4232 domain-containing protein [Streptomyces sp. HPF1205]|uniref:DUF4232 domain-containing protein n=1 Tax=Streptomyces sp. HPF1205 TaxID=2873262 RepID=UPI0021F13996|nr:DUF4232 domain-containing protein [Streptomyces sp. HPF1205]
MPDDPRDDARPPGATGDSSAGGSSVGRSPEGGSASGPSAGGPAKGSAQGDGRARGAGPEFGGDTGWGSGGDIGRGSGGETGRGTGGDIGRGTGGHFGRGTGRDVGVDVAGGSGGAVDRAPGRAFGPDAARAATRGHGGDLSRDFDAGGPDGDEPDPLEWLLRPPGDYLSPPPGSFERIRRKAARRRRNRAAAGGVVVAAMITGSVYLAGALSPHDSGDVVGPPATSSQVTHVPTPPEPTGRAPRPSTSPPPTTRDGRPRPVTSATTPTALPSGTSGGRVVPPTPTAATRMCTTAQLSAELGGGNAGAGNLYRYLVLTNRSATSCHIAGYPGLSLLDADGNEIGAPATRDRRPYQPVILAPGDSASDTIHTADQQGTCLPTSVSLRIYPPGNRASLVIAGRVTDCDNLLTVTPFTAGRTGNPAN